MLLRATARQREEEKENKNWKKRKLEETFHLFGLSGSAREAELHRIELVEEEAKEERTK